MKATLEAPRIEEQARSSSFPGRGASPPPSRSLALFPPRGEQRRSDDLLSRRLAQADARVSAGAVAPTIDLARFKRDLAAFDFATPRPLPALLEWTIAQMENGVVHVTHPHYFGLFNPAPSFPAQCADRIAAAFNPQLASSTTSPVPVEIEAHVIRSVARRAGLPAEAGGHFTTGGTEANYSALICALTEADRQFATEGARAFSGAPVFYASRDSHRAWLKIAHQAGIGRSAVRLVATDGTGRMEPDALADAVRADRAAGCVPVMIAATAGTTNAGMVDPLAECAAIARDAGLWYHVDAAWGGGLIASDRLRGHLAGVELADSVTVDAHKWLATTMGCGMFLTRRPDALSAAFHVSTSYMPSNVAAIDPYVTSVQWSRRFLGLRLFLSLAAAGWSGYGAHVEKSVALARLLEQQLAARSWRVVNDASLAVLCIEPPGGAGAVQAIVRRVVASGRAWVSEAEFEGRPIIRACVTHGRTTPEDVAALVDALDAAARDCP
ncbi:MAG TPA: pyridoxal-dependent decarboxylase [Stellaceae bacterium]|nr:pyridoxal-dependent decarboxylase [Stellaceae bacterium]